MGLAHNISYQLNSFCITSEKIYTKEKIELQHMYYSLQTEQN